MHCGLDGLDLLLVGFNQQKPFNPRTHGTIGLWKKMAKINFHEY
jgi:hypothetical protein